MRTLERIKPGRPSERTATALWVALVAGASVVFSLAPACAMPFPALATIAGARMHIRDAVGLVGFAWFANQVLGYLVLGYPQTWDSFAWAAATGVAALIAAVPAYALARRTRTMAPLLTGFGGAFLLYETILFAATAFLPSAPDAFSPGIVWRIFWINALALAGLVVLHRAGLSVGIAPRTSLPQPASATAAPGRTFIEAKALSPARRRTGR